MDLRGWIFRAGVPGRQAARRRNEDNKVLRFRTSRRFSGRLIHARLPAYSLAAGNPTVFKDAASHREVA